MIYKVIRVVNHFIEHIIKYYANDEDAIGPKSEWYFQWKTMYPIIKSSKRSMVDTYIMLFSDYTTASKYIDVYSFIMSLIEKIPHLKQCYDILPVDDENSEEINRNKF